jgi:hypothetical protein
VTLLSGSLADWNTVATIPMSEMPCCMVSSSLPIFASVPP